MTECRHCGHLSEDHWNNEDASYISENKWGTLNKCGNCEKCEVMK